MIMGDQRLPQAENILFLMTDEHQAAALSCAGHGIVKTPNLDRLAARGTRFTNAYTPCPICVPARAAVATGRYVHQCGYWDNAHGYDGRLPSWGHRLGEAGADCISIGKLHYRSTDDPTGFAQEILPMHIQDGIGQVWGSVRNPLPPSRDMREMLGHIGAGQSSYNRFDIKVADEAAAWLEQRPADAAPFAAFVSFVAPHFPLTVDQAYLDLYPAEDMPLPDLHPDRGYGLHPWVARMNDIESSDATLGTDARRREAIAAYYGLCSFVDDQIGRVLDALEHSPFADNTLIIYTSDHGEVLGRRGRWGKSLLYGEATRIPMILAGPGLSQGELCETPVSLLDVPPTMTAALGLDADPNWVGQSLLDIMNSEDDPNRLIFSEYHACMSPTGGFMLTDARWKYHYYVDYPPELFDLKADPAEAHNLAADPAYQAILARMHTQLLAICDPVTVDAEAKADQDRLVERFGGPAAALNVGPKGATPAPV